MNYNLKKKYFSTKSLKGISPIVASVLLIAFSTAIAAVVGTWAMGYTQGQLTDIELCEDINVEFINVSYASSSKEGSFRIQNTGPTIDKYDIYVFASGNLEEKVKEITTPLKKSEKKTIIFETEMENVKGVKIKIPTCFGKSFFGLVK